MNKCITSFVLLHWFTSALHIIDMFILLTLYLLILPISVFWIDLAAFRVTSNDLFVVFYCNDCLVWFNAFLIWWFSTLCFLDMWWIYDKWYIDICTANKTYCNVGSKCWFIEMKQSLDKVMFRKSMLITKVETQFSDAPSPFVNVKHNFLTLLRPSSVWSTIFWHSFAFRQCDAD